LTWDASTGDVGGYRVERSGDGVTFTAIASLGPTTLGYNDDTVSAGNTYWYRVFAYNAEAGDSLPSNVVSIAIGVAAPAAPTNLAAADGAPNSVDLTWDDNADNETGYYVERAQDPAPLVWSRIATTGPFAGAGTEGTYTDNTVGPNETYYYRVQAFIEPGGVVSIFSNEAMITVANQIPEAPADLTILKIQTKRLTIGWLDKSTNEESFEVQRAPDNSGAPGTWADIAVLPINTDSYTDSGLTTQTTYWYRVRACNVVGCSAYTAEESGTTR
jgi:fibronectin type 3 domain-containing protein